MRWRHFMAAGVGLSLCLGGLRVNAAPNQMIPKGLGQAITIPGLISYRVPAGWDASDEVNGSPWVRGPISNGFVPDITFNALNHGSLDDFVKNYQPTLYDGINIPLRYVGQKPFVTSAGVKGIRCVSVDPSNPSRATLFDYVFLSSDGQQMEVACACATADSGVYGPVFDATAKTVVIAKGD